MCFPMTTRAHTSIGRVIALLVLGAAILLAVVCPGASALDPSLDISQYAHTVWTIQDGSFKGNIYAMAQTPDGYLWLGTEFGLLRFDGIRTSPWQPPAGQHLPDNAINRLLVTGDGTLWIGTAVGLATWSGGKLTRRPELGDHFVASLFEDREGTVWAGSLANPGHLCALRSGGAQCYGEDGAFGRAVWSLYEDSSGNLWAAAQSGLWRMKPGPPRRYPTPAELIGLSKADNGLLLVAMHGAGLLQLVGDNLEAYPIRSPINSNRLLPDRDLNSNRLLRDRDGGLWIGTVERGLIHVHHGRTDIFSRANGLSGDVVLSLFEDREGDIWVATTGGLDRFRELPVATLSVKQGLSSDATQSVLGATDGSIWIGAHEGLTRWKNGQTTIFGEASGLPDDAPQSLFQDDRGRIWVSTDHGLAYFKDGRFVATNALRGGRVHFITGDKAGNLWLSEDRSLLHVRDGRLVEHFLWSELGRSQHAQVLLSGREPGGVWLGFWQGGGASYFKDHQVRASYTAADGLGEGGVAGLQLDRDGALWAATHAGVSRLKDGQIATLTSRNGLPCDTIHWTMDDDDRSFWLYTACGLVRIVRSEMDAWIADPKHRVETTVWAAADGVRLRSTASSEYGPRVAKSTDGKLWFVTGEGVQIVDSRRLAVNQVQPPVHIEQIIANHKIYWQRTPGAPVADVRLPALIRDLQITFTALSLVAPEKVRFRFKLEPQDSDWREAVNERQVQYSNLAPGAYRFRVIACNNSGVWNEQGDTLDFSIAPAYWQTSWFRTLCAAAFLALLSLAYQARVRQLRQQEQQMRDVIETIPSFAWTALPDGPRDFANRHWEQYTGMSSEKTVGSGWESAVHPEDLKRYVEKWRVSVATGEPFEQEVRFRRAEDGQYRWFLTRAVPLRDARGKILKWYGTSTDIEDRKRAEQLQADLAHINRVSLMGELAASISHELKQPIAAAITNANTCMRWLKRDQPDLEEACEATGRILDDGKRAVDIIERLRSLYKKSPPKRESVEVNDIVQEMVVLLRGEANQHAVSIRMDLAAILPRITADRVQLQQVLMNLMLNAIEAMKETGGILTVKSELDQDGRVAVSVSDTGVGLPAEKSDQIFSAFFTTKPQGSGMGLSISRSIVESHGGRLWATANSGRGATFHFILPTAAQEENTPVMET